jgi:hypothetical protein
MAGIFHDADFFALRRDLRDLVVRARACGSVINRPRPMRWCITADRYRRSGADTAVRFVSRHPQFNGASRRTFNQTGCLRSLPVVRPAPLHVSICLRHLRRGIRVLWRLCVTDACRQSGLMRKKTRADTRDATRIGASDYTLGGTAFLRSD